MLREQQGSSNDSIMRACLVCTLSTEGCLCCTLRLVCTLSTGGCLCCTFRFGCVGRHVAEICMLTVVGFVRIMFVVRLFSDDI